MNKKAEVILVVVLYLFTLYLWTLPVQSSHLPFGDVDSTTHFTIGDWMAMNDKSMLNLPYYMTFVVGPDAKGKLVYPPQFNTAEAIISSLSTDRILPFYIFYATMSSLFVITSYILVRKLYGFWPAYISSFFLVFSSRDYMTYLWGMWPQVASFAITPVIMYSFYQYASSLVEGKKAGIYLYITVILLITQFAFHPQGLAFSLGFIAIYSTLLTWKSRKLIFPIKQVAFSAALGIILILIFAPFQLHIIKEKVGLTEQVSELKEKAPLSNLFLWYKRPDRNVGVPETYFTFKDTYGYWALPLLILGLAVVIFRRNPQDVLMIAFVITMYLFLHLENIGFPRAHRFLEMEAWLFAPLIAIGLLSIPSIAPKSMQPKLKALLIAGFAVAVALLLAVPAYSTLKDAYKDYSRTTEIHLQLSEWMRNNLPEESNTMYVGYTTFAKKKWLRSLSHRSIVYDNPVVPKSHPAINLTDHVLIDYSEALVWTQGNQQAVSELRAWELQNLGNKTLLYEHPSKLARVYSLG